MVALYTVAQGTEVLAEDHNSLVRLLTGTAGTEQPVSFSRLDDATNYALTVKQLDTTNGRAFQVLNAAGSAQIMSVNKYGLAVGTTPAPVGNIFVVSLTDTATARQMASFEYANTGGTSGDVSAVRAVAYENGTADNQTRAIEAHMIRNSSTGTLETHGVDVSIQGKATSPGTIYYNGVRVRALGSTWGVSSPVRQDNGVFVGYDTDGFKYGFRYVGTAAESYPELFSVDQVGVMRGRDHHPTADALYDIGSSTGPKMWRAVYTYNTIVGNGSASVPSMAFLNSLTTGFYRIGSNDIGVSTNGTRRANFDATGNVVIGTAALATNATDGFLYVTSSAGAPSGTPTAYTGRVPIEIDTTNGRLYAYYGGAWHYVALT